MTTRSAAPRGLHPCRLEKQSVAVPVFVSVSLRWCCWPFEKIVSPPKKLSRPSARRGRRGPSLAKSRQVIRAVRAVRLLLAHWRPLAVTDTRLAAVSRGHPYTRGRQSVTYTVCVLGTSPPWWPMSSIGLVVRGCTHRSLPVVWRGAGTSAVLPRHAPVASPRRGWVGGRLRYRLLDAPQSDRRVETPW